MKKQMFYSAGVTIFHSAKELRNQPTGAERILWMHLRTRPRDCKFSRQHPVGNYILDFYCHALKLAIEADGSIHNDLEVVQNDMERQKRLEEQGIQFIRFTNEEILLNLDTLIERIDFTIDERLYKKAGSDLSPFEANESD